MTGEGPWYPLDTLPDNGVGFENQALAALGGRDIDQCPLSAAPHLDGSTSAKPKSAMRSNSASANSSIFVPSETMQATW